MHSNIRPIESQFIQKTNSLVRRMYVFYIRIFFSLLACVKRARLSRWWRKDEGIIGIREMCMRNTRSKTVVSPRDKKSEEREMEGKHRYGRWVALKQTFRSVTL